MLPSAENGALGFLLAHFAKIAPPVGRSFSLNKPKTLR